MKKLNKKEMSKVSGGYYSTTTKEAIERHKGSPVDKYDGWENSTYIFERMPYYLMVGKLVNSYEDDQGYGTTARRHKVEVMDIYVEAGYGFNIGSIADISADLCQMYEYVD